MYHKTKRRKARTRRAIPLNCEETIQVRRKGIMNQKKTQCKQIVDYIRKKGYITDLESAGFVFAKPRLKVGGCRQPVTHYSIIENGVEV